MRKYLLDKPAPIDVPSNIVPEKPKAKWHKIKPYIRLIVGSIFISIASYVLSESYSLNPRGGFGKFTDPSGVAIGVFFSIIGLVILAKGIKEYLAI
jgi:hypothetical protein